jgi:FAD/FMN-containing dehydrogenase
MFELVLAQALQPVITFKQKRNPISQPAPAYVLLEVGLGAGQSERERLEEFLAGEIESEILTDLVMSESGAQAEELLSLRESIPETLSSHFSIHKNDISVLPSLMGSFLNQALAVAAQHEPTFIPAVFGHCGDGNIHLNFLKPEGLPVSEFFERCHALDAVMFRVVQSFRGSVAAEHGVGILKREFLPLTRTPEELAMMRLLKQAIDPQGIMNPGKILPE